MTALAMQKAKQKKITVPEMSFTIECIICVINVLYYKVEQIFNLLILNPYSTSKEYRLKV